MQGIHKSTFDMRILFTTLLAGLLLVAPCKVRNSLEHSLGLEKSEVSNKLKTTISIKSCASYEAVQISQDHTTKVVDIGTLQLPAMASTIVFTASNNHKKFSAVKKQPFAAEVPLYILYRQFQVYS
ncbi:hypothetical protein [Allomuricauda sp. F6463D]|uniref:hypothetical protein n=1 Tax=Allomuricauda sp. F6463D TaxID=2926409 RepID=UPI001FF0F47B|nr:hypothetical protein [Muricauda sp. F6463D]MCK0159898.1 hypothetical protein [Muricauda sp. F6463D]